MLASDVQVTDAWDGDRVRFSLTGEAGLNDGTAFPFVLLGLGLLGLHDLGAGWWRWWAVDVAWGLAAGLAVGWLLGTRREDRPVPAEAAPGGGGPGRST